MLSPMTSVSPGLGDSINMAHCKMHYYTSHPTLNYFAVVPHGGTLADSEKLIPSLDGIPCYKKSVR